MTKTDIKKQGTKKGFIAIEKSYYFNEGYTIGKKETAEALSKVAINILSEYVDRLTENLKNETDFPILIKQKNSEDYKWAIEEIKKKFIGDENGKN